MIEIPERVTVVTAILLAAAGVGACSSATSPSSPSSLSSSGGPALSATQVGGTWRLVSLQPPDQAEPVRPPAGAAFSVEVAGDRAAITADCNHCSGPAFVRGSTLTIGPLLACTRAFCRSAPFDEIFLRMLVGDNALTIDGDTLTLRSDRGALRFER